jgi:CubicO group peptidase (beta-lactamase class C family)
MDPARLAALTQTLPKVYPPATSLLIVRGGDLVLEKYFAGQDAASRRKIYSCTKSFISTLIGIAIDQGRIPGVQARLLDYFPGSNPANPSPAKSALTLQDVLTMSSGLEWSEGDPAYRDLYYSRDWSAYMLDKPLVTPPGTKFNYCSGCSHLLAAVVKKAVGQDIFDYARANLFEPIGIRDARWERNPQGDPIGGWGLQITSRDMARLGYLFLRQGEWNGRQVVSSAWVRAATAAHIHAEPGMDYGYQWWVRPSIHGYSATGLGGQIIAVIPEKDMVVVVTSENGDNEKIFRLIEEAILPAAE